MKRLFLDTNVLVAVLNKEYPLFTYAAKVLSLSDHGFELFTSPTCIAIAFYFSTKKCGEVQSKKKIGTLLNHIHLTTVDESCTKKSVENPQILDIEDGIQYYSAASSNCDFIITDNLEDFHFSEIPIRSCETFLKHELQP